LAKPNYRNKPKNKSENKESCMAVIKVETTITGFLFSSQLRLEGNEISDQLYPAECLTQGEIDGAVTRRSNKEHLHS
jgi:hypothetical protein